MEPHKDKGAEEREQWRAGSRNEQRPDCVSDTGNKKNDSSVPKGEISGADNLEDSHDCAHCHNKPGECPHKHGECPHKSGECPQKQQNMKECPYCHRKHECDSKKTDNHAQQDSKPLKSSLFRKALPWCIGLAAGGIAVVAAPLAIAAVGFGTGGIAAGSLAASMMSTAATSGIGMGIVSALQSAGAAGLAVSTQIGLAIAGASAGAGATSIGLLVEEKVTSNSDKSNQDKSEESRQDEEDPKGEKVSSENREDSVCEVIKSGDNGTEEVHRSDNVGESQDMPLNSERQDMPLNSERQDMTLNSERQDMPLNSERQVMKNRPDRWVP